MKMFLGKFMMCHSLGLALAAAPGKGKGSIAEVIESEYKRYEDDLGRGLNDYTNRPPCEKYYMEKVMETIWERYHCSNEVDKVLNDPNVMRRFIFRFPEAYQYVGTDLQGNVSFNLEVLPKVLGPCPDRLCMVKAKTQDLENDQIREWVERAVRESRALEYASPKLKNDQEFVDGLIQSQVLPPGSLWYASRSVRRSLLTRYAGNRGREICQGIQSLRF